MSIPQITVSERAQAHIRTQVALTRSNFLRLGVKESGCNGFMYTLDFLESAATDDHLLHISEQVTVCVKDQDLALVDGTEIDMVTQGLNSALIFKNSNATSYCGCGESFALIDDNSDDNNNDSSARSTDLSDLATDATQPT